MRCPKCNKNHKREFFNEVCDCGFNWKDFNENVRSRYYRLKGIDPKVFSNADYINHCMALKQKKESVLKEIENETAIRSGLYYQSSDHFLVTLIGSCISIAVGIAIGIMRRKILFPIVFSILFIVFFVVLEQLIEHKEDNINKELADKQREKINEDLSCLNAEVKRIDNELISLGYNIDDKTVEEIEKLVLREEYGILFQER